MHIYIYCHVSLSHVVQQYSHESQYDDHWHFEYCYFEPLQVKLSSKVQMSIEIHVNSKAAFELAM